MKSISVVCAVALTVTCICILQTTAVPFSQSETHPQAEQQQQMDSEVPQSEQQWTAASAAEETLRPEEVLFRTKRQSHLSLCRYCCNCCKNKGCGFCCRF
ncbi:hepcidin-1 [Astyanax mexicanus]|uniref:Hepcidin isoform X2 n=2 Tax=Astyanax mexicanus TaxID=7994 RepID=A0A8T2MQQ7_ASTMX|nr:hepcidin-1 [Astyanax mexicanus]KAG9283776.1 hepcidin isoform X2 [Astyanax mexicanus]